MGWTIIARSTERRECVTPFVVIRVHNFKGFAEQTEDMHRDLLCFVDVVVVVVLSPQTHHLMLRMSRFMSQT